MAPATHRRHLQYSTDTETDMEIVLLDNLIECSGSRWLTCIVMVGGKPVATCEVSGWDKSHVWIMSLCVQSKHRGKGIGTQMVNAIIATARKAGKLSILLYVNKANEGACRLYRRLGFASHAEDATDLHMHFTINQPRPRRRA
jgi:ribosomal protein S18 acetylase RimI-like enzyme